MAIGNVAEQWGVAEADTKTNNVVDTDTKLPTTSKTTDTSNFKYLLFLVA